MKNYLRLIQELSGTQTHVGVQTAHDIHRVADIATVFIRPWKGKTWACSAAYIDAKSGLKTAMEMCAKALLHEIKPEKYKPAVAWSGVIGQGDFPPEVWEALTEGLPE